MILSSSDFHLDREHNVQNCDVYLQFNNQGQKITRRYHTPKLDCPEEKIKQEHFILCEVDFFPCGVHLIPCEVPSPKSLIDLIVDMEGLEPLIPTRENLAAFSLTLSSN